MRNRLGLFLALVVCGTAAAQQPAPKPGSHSTTQTRTTSAPASPAPATAATADPAAALETRLEAGLKLVQGDGCPMPDKLCAMGRIAAMSMLDQTARREPVCTGLPEAERRECGAAKGERIRRVDAANAPILKTILETHGWPDAAGWGSGTESSTSILVQHADRDGALQKTALEMLKKSVEAGRSEADNYAYLYDRVAVNEGRAQLYGTQGGCRNGAWRPDTLDQPDGIEARRKAMGLEPFAAYREKADKRCRGDG